MLQINHLTGFGVESGGGGPAGVLSASYIKGVTDTNVANHCLDFTPSDLLTYTNNKTYVVAMAADNAGTNGSSALQYDGFGFDETGAGFSVLFSPYRIHATQDPGAANAGVTLAAACGHHTGATNTNGYLNVNYVYTIQPPSKAAILLEVSDTLAGATTFVSATSTAGSSASPTVSATLQAGDLMIGFLATEGRVAPTADGGAGWSSRVGVIADTTVASTSVTIHSQNFRATVDGSKTWSPTFGSARDYVIGCIVLRPAA